MKQKYLKSKFNPELVEETIANVSWELMVQKENNNRNQKETKEPERKPRIVWATQFKNIMKLSNKEKDLAPQATITYCKPSTLGNALKNYKQISRNDKTNTNYGTKKCKRCGLCGHHGNLKNMVLETDHIIHNGKKIHLKQNLNCKSYGIYAARCKKCSDFYVGQTKNYFSQRWNTHRCNWKKMIKGNYWEKTELSDKNERKKDTQALFLHYSRKHKILLNGNF